jgi:mRNA interferase MazF
MNYQKGDIVIIKFPFSDLSRVKKRPSLIISNDLVNQTGDYLMVQITSKIRNDELSLEINQKHYIDQKALPLQSCLRLHKIFLLNEDLIISKYTAVKESFMNTIIERIIKLIKS